MSVEVNIGKRRYIFLNDNCTDRALDLSKDFDLMTHKGVEDFENRVDKARIDWAYVWVNG